MPCGRWYHRCRGTRCLSEVGEGEREKREEDGEDGMVKGVTEVSWDTRGVEKLIERCLLYLLRWMLDVVRVKTRKVVVSVWV